MKFKLIIHNKDYTEDRLEFNSIDELNEFISKLNVEKLIDGNFAEMEYTIVREII